ncbi:MAG: acyl-CoA dehydrogenase [Actinomycetota bacterium]|nr:acyl-CoA dehydrogenase [Actinomycetota bacterium]
MDSTRPRESARLPDWADAMVAAAHEAPEDVGAAIELARKYGGQFPLPGSGQTHLRWRLLALVAGSDLTAGRVLEAHCDALAILAESRAPEPEGAWGVFAAEASGQRLEAIATEAGFVLRGTKPWCSIAGELDHALVTAMVSGDRQLFAVDLRHGSVHVDRADSWVARGLRAVPSVPVHFDSTPGRPIGSPGWYLSRPGFAWGGMGVAACWFGAGTALAHRLRDRAAQTNSELAQWHAGAVDAALHGASCALSAAAQAIDDGAASGLDGELLALRVRAVVADAVERTITHVGHALGPAPLAFDAEHARRVADLEIYVRQHHAERDLAALGRRLPDPT